jgi:hypothetical protein
MKQKRAHPRVELQATLIDDLRATLLARLQSDGYKVPESMHSDASSVVECYFTSLKRRIAERPRRIHIARQRFYVPAAVAAEFAAIVKRIEHGGDLTPFLSKGILRPASIDQLLYEWDLHHLHLSERGAGVFAARSDYVLMARFTTEDAYLIWVGRHPEGEGWSRAEFLHRVHEEWPDSIYSHRAQGFSRDDDDDDDDDDPYSDANGTTDKTVVAMRKKNFTYIFWTADGTGYSPPGGGMMASGLSADVRIATDRLMNSVHQWQEKHVGDPTELQRLARKHGRQMQGTVRLSLELDGEDLVVVWAEGAMRFTIGKLPTSVHG